MNGKQHSNAKGASMQCSLAKQINFGYVQQNRIVFFFGKTDKMDVWPFFVYAVQTV